MLFFFVSFLLFSHSLHSFCVCNAYYSIDAEEMLINKLLSSYLSIEKEKKRNIEHCNCFVNAHILLYTIEYYALQINNEEITTLSFSFQHIQHAKVHSLFPLLCIAINCVRLFYRQNRIKPYDSQMNIFFSRPKRALSIWFCYGRNLPNQQKKSSFYADMVSNVLNRQKLCVTRWILSIQNKLRIHMCVCALIFDFDFNFP